MLQMSLRPKEGKCTLRFLFLTSWKSTHWRRVLRRMFSIRQDGGNQNLTVTRWNLICIYLTFQGNLLNLRLFVVIFFQRKSVRCVTVNLKLQSIFSFTKISLENRLWLIIHHCQKKRNEMRVMYFSAVSLFSYPLESHQRKHFIAKVLVSKFLAFFHFSGHACNTWSF